ncbi:hypothetical protein COCNU_09G008410 [Cocos nucifera]|uniref:Histone deacetylase complex subunit SAP30 Sin3 binding domain-containing protein n=1 Tax=Cocos nucifera TaxID=13894 RepID=A0A8K0IK20_COCNU|nr:hypothetical protein COCNU_09G008410 [Cocos nucifera]
MTGCGAYAKKEKGRSFILAVGKHTVLKNGVEVKLQRNALSVLEAPTGNEEDDYEIDCNNSICSSSDMGDKDVDYSSSFISQQNEGLGIPDLGHPQSRQSVVLATETQKLISLSLKRVDLAKLGTATLWRYWKHFNLVSTNPNPSKEQLIHGVQHHFLSQVRVDH